MRPSGSRSAARCGRPKRAEAFQRGLDRFYREGQILARLTYPNIVRVTDLFRERGTAYLVMD